MHLSVKVGGREYYVLTQGGEVMIPLDKNEKPIKTLDQKLIPGFWEVENLV